MIKHIHKLFTAVTIKRIVDTDVLDGMLLPMINVIHLVALRTGKRDHGTWPMDINSLALSCT